MIPFVSSSSYDKHVMEYFNFDCRTVKIIVHFIIAAGAKHVRLCTLIVTNSSSLLAFFNWQMRKLNRMSGALTELSFWKRYKWPWQLNRISISPFPLIALMRPWHFSCVSSVRINFYVTANSIAAEIRHSLLFVSFHAYK